MKTSEATTQELSLSEVHESVDTSKHHKKWSRFFAFIGPAYLVSVGYMDPGNWATDLQGGAQFGYTLIWVLLMSNLMALLLQSLSTRLGIVRRRDLAGLVRGAGLEVDRIYCFNALGVLGWVAKSTRRNPSLDPASLRAYELLLPLYRWVERMHPPPFGLSYVVRARRA